MKRIAKADWLKQGLQGLGERGEAALRIESLCKDLGVTKGSFYHHFQNIDDYLAELLHYWETENTLKIIQETEQSAIGQNKADKLTTLVIAVSHQPEVMIRSWSARNEVVKHCLERVDSLRTKYLQQLYQEQGLPEKQALDIAKIEYATFIGMQQLYRDHLEAEKMHLSKVFQQLIKSILP